MSTASPAILLNFFEKQSAQNHPQYLSGLLRALFPTTFLEIGVSYIFLWRHTYRSGIVWTDTLWKGMTKPVPVVHISAVWGSFWGQSRDDYEYHPCYWCFSLETCLMRVYRDFQFRNNPIACLHNIFLEVESVKVYHFHERERSVEAVPWHKNRAKGNFSCLNKNPVQLFIRYGFWDGMKTIRYIVHWYQ